MIIERHGVDGADADVDDHIEHYRQRLARNVGKASLTAADLGTIAGHARTYAGLMSRRDGDEAEIRRAWRIGAYALTEACRLAALDGRGVSEVFLGEGEPRLVPAQVTSYSSAISWVDAFCLAMACREVHLIDTLITTPVPVLRRSSTRCDEWMYLFIDALQAWQTERPDVTDRIIAAMRATDPAQIRVGSVSAALNLGVPEIDLLWCLAVDHDRFGEALATAVREHREHWSAPRWRSDPHGWIAVVPLAMACVAAQRGWAVPVESGYLPSFMISERRDGLSP